MNKTLAESKRQEQQRIEWVRWAILCAVSAGAEYGVTPAMLLRVANADEVYLPIFSSQEIRAEVHYLRERELVRTDAHPLAPRVFITNHGRDIVDFTVPVLPGIYRPALPE